MKNSNRNILFLQSSIFLDSQHNYALSNQPPYVTHFQIHQLLRPPGYKASLRRVTLLFLMTGYVETYTSLFSRWHNRYSYYKYIIFSLNLTLNLLMTTIVAPPSNASKCQMGFNSAFKGLMYI
jgi:hypothetical protein